MRNRYWGLLILVVVLIFVGLFMQKESFIPVTEQGGCPPHYKRDVRMANVACIPCPVINGIPLC